MLRQWSNYEFSRFWNPDRTVRSDRKNRESLCFAIFLTSITILWLKKKQGSVPYGSKNRDRFLRFGRFLFLSKVSANTSAVLWVFSDLEPNEREKNKNKKTEKKKKQRKKKTTKKKEKSKNVEINPHSKQPSSCEPKHVTNFQMTNPSIFTLLLCFVLTSRC